MPSYRYVESFRLKGTWRNAKNSWGHSLHRTCSRTGSFPPSLARYFIERFSDPGSRVLDAFSGKGTAPLEACLSGRVGVGNDISPEAYVLTHAKVRPINLVALYAFLDNIARKIHPNEIRLDDVDRDVKLFHSKQTLKQIVAFREALMDDVSNEAYFSKALMCGIIHGASKTSLSLPCSHSFSMSPDYVRQYAKEHNLKKPRRKVLHSLKIRAKEVLRDGLPNVFGEAYSSDACLLPLENESVGLIVTSPPYFNKQTYAWDNWLRLWFLGFDYRDVRKTLFQSAMKGEFVQFMTKSFREMYRVLRNNSACFVVVGDVILNHEEINTARLLVEPARSVGFDVQRIINDDIPKNQKYFMFIPDGKGVRKDRILELHKGKVRERSVRLPWELSR